MPQKFAQLPPELIVKRDYRPQFKLDYIGNTGVGVSASQFGTGIAGGVAGIFSDILGNNQLFGALSINGEIYDFGGQFAYLNQKGRINWGASISHIPYRTGYLEAFVEKTNRRGLDTTYYVQQLNLVRIFEEKISAFTYYPISSTRLARN